MLKFIQDQTQLLDMKRNMASTSRCLVCFLLLSLASLWSNCEEQHKTRLYKHGHVIIGGLFPIHLQQVNEKCVDLRPEALVWSEAMKLAIEKINSNSSLLPNVTLGYDIQDTCGSEQVAISSAAQFSFINTLMFNERYSKAVNSCVEVSSMKNKTQLPVIAVLGGEDSRVSVNMANVLQLGDIPQISYGSTSAQLSNKETFRTFFRTVPSDEFQSQAMAQTVKENRWTCVAVIGTDDVYGRSGIASFQYSANDQKICIALTELFPVYDSENRIQILVEKLKSMKHVEIIILYSLPAQAVQVFKEVLKQSMVDKTWIASDGWAESTYIRQKQFIPIIQGTIGFEFRDVHFLPLERHLMDLNSTSLNNIWWEEFWTTQFNCSRSRIQNNVTQLCTGDEKITSDFYAKELHTPLSAYVVDAVYAVAFALSSFQDCPGSNCYNLADVTPEMMVGAIKSTSFHGLTGSFDFSQADKQARYDIVNLQVNSLGGIEPVNIGQWDSNNLQMDDTKIQWHNGRKPRSSCGPVCPKGKYKGKPIQCVWGCFPCSEDTYTDSEDSTQCKKCPEGFVHSVNYTTCTEVHPEYIHWQDPWGIGLLFTNCVGIIMTLFVLGIIIRNYKTAVFTETGGFLNLFLLISILLSYGFNFILLSPPSDFRCTFLALLFYIIYPSAVATFFLKILFIRRCFDASDTINVQGSPSSTSKTFKRPMWQYYLLAVTAVVFPEILSIVWIIVGNLHSGKLVINRDVVYMTCRSLDTFGGEFLMYINIVYLFVILIGTTVYSHQTKKICQAQKFLEAKHMFYALVIFLVTLTTFYPGWTLIEGPVLQVFACLTNITAATGIILCAYGPKIHILLFYPVLNTYAHIHPIHTSVTSAALNMGLHLVNTGRGRAITLRDDSTPPQSSPEIRPRTDTINNSGSFNAQLTVITHSNDVSADA